MSLALFALFLGLACTPKSEDTDTGGDDGGDTGDPVVDWCAEQGLTSRAWQEATESDALYAVISDISFEDQNGEQLLSSLWSGCDSFLFIQDEPSQNEGYGWPRDLWERDLDDLFDRLPLNVHLFFSSDATGSENQEESFAVLQEEIDDALADLDPELAMHWEGRIHYLQGRSSAQDGWLGDLHRSPGWGVGIDRFQRIRYIGSYGDWNRYNSSVGWFEPNISMAANESIYYNFESDRDDVMLAEGATTTPLFRNDQVSGSVSTTVDLPSAADAAAYDTLTLDLTMECVGDGELGDCPAWDYMAYLYVCDQAADANPYTSQPCQPYVAEVLGLCVADGEDSKATCRTADDCATDPGGDTGDTGTTPVEWACEGYSEAIAADTLPGTCNEPGGTTEEKTYSCNAEGTGYDELACSCDTEVGRWITTYHREGRWWYDISPMLPLLDDGGSWTFRFDTSGPYELIGDLRWSNQGKDARPDETVYAFSGGTINVDYNSSYSPYLFTPPAGTTKVELATVISQHGADGNNCGEFCDIAHHFTVNGDEANEVVRDFPEASTADDCMDKVSEGTVPNQFGTWWYGRAGWCPGKEVKTVVADITDQVNLGTENSLEYRALYNGADYTGSATIRMRSWLVFSQ